MIKPPKGLFLLSSFLFYFSHHCFSQTNEDTALKADKPVHGPTGYISINCGYQFPMGSYKLKGYFAGPTKATQFATGPYVKPGPIISMAGGKPLGYSNFGIAATAFFCENKFDATRYVSDMNNEQIGTFSSGTATPYYTSSLMAGLFFTSPHDKISFDIRLLGGLVYIKPPALTYSGTNYVIANVPVMDEWTLTPKKIFTSTFDLGGQIRYFITPKLITALSCDLFFSSASKETYDGNAPNYGFSDRIAVDFISVLVGIGYRL